MKPLPVLVLDGDPERRQRLMALFRDAELDAVAAPDSQAAAEAIGSGKFSTLVLDLTLPYLDGSVLRRALASDPLDVPETLEDAERAHLARVLRHTSGNKRKAAHLLGISRSTLLNKVRKYGLAR